jgi:hypothetical protein
MTNNKNTTIETAERKPGLRQKEYAIFGRSKYGTEEIDTAETKQSAEYLLNEYRIAFGGGWSLWIKARFAE